jgi:8-oxo-dGTP diphosphatase
MKNRLLALALSTFRRLPVPLRRWIIHVAAPSYTVGAVAVLRTDDGGVLLLRERHHDGWSVPGGLLNRGEDAADALVRELREEIALDLAADQVGEATALVDAPARRIDLVFTVALPGNLSVAAQEPEVLEARWFDVTALPEMFEPSATVLRSAGIHVPDALD